MTQPKTIFDRININDLITGLSTLSYDEVDFETLIKMFPNADWQDFYSIAEPVEMKGFSVDDYNFKLYRVDDSISCGSSVYILNSTTILDKDVEVWVCNGDSEAEFSGTIKHDGSNYYLSVEFEVL